MRRRCFLTDGHRLILPAFGTYAGGLNALDPAIAQLFPDDYDALVVGRDTVRRLSWRQLRPDAAFWDRDALTRWHSHGGIVDDIPKAGKHNRGDWRVRDALRFSSECALLRRSAWHRPSRGCLRSAADPTLSVV